MVSEKTQALIDAARLKVVGRENPRLRDVPEWVEEWRPQQKDAVKQIVDAFSDHDVVVLDAPTGSGKTLIAESVRRMLGVRGLYVCNNIQLQHQFANDYAYATLLKGRGNYKPLSYEGYGDVTCSDCTLDDTCPLCPAKKVCPYEVAKVRALKADLAVLNSTYLLTEGNGPGQFKGRPFIVWDEADTLEQEVMRYVGVRIGRANCARYGISEPNKVTVADSWRQWMDDVIPKLVDKRSKVRGEDIRAGRQRDYLTRLIGKLRWIAPQVGEGWVYTGGKGIVEFKPVHVGGACKRMLWPLGGKHLLMSASIISAGALLDDLGWEGTYGTVNLGSTFEVGNRRVKIATCANVTKKGGDDERRKLGDGIRRICDAHPDERILIHAVSYDLSRYIAGELGRNGRDVLTYNSSDEKGAILAKSRRSGRSIIVAPSFDRGVDLPDDLCRVVIVAKIPYPYLGDRQVSARLYGKGGRTWYTVQTVRSIVQMTGRGVRHEDDFCTGYILDSQFQALWNNARGLFPRWWVEALQWGGNVA